MTSIRTTVLTLAAGALLGLGLGWRLWRPTPAPVETYAPAIVQPDKSVVLERKPDATAKPAHQVPKGSTVERVVEVTVQPKPVPASVVHADSAHGDSLVCPPVRVDLSLVRLGDQTRRVIASSPDGEVVGGVDIPVEAAKPAPKPLKWAAGGLWNPTDRTYGAFLDHDLGPFRVGVEGVQQRPYADRAVSWAAQVKVGIRF